MPPKIKKSSAVPGSPIRNELRVNAPGHDELGLPVPPDEMDDVEYLATRPAPELIERALKARPHPNQHKGNKKSDGTTAADDPKGKPAPDPKDIRT